MEEIGIYEGLAPLPLGDIVDLKTLVHVEAGTTAFFDQANGKSQDFLLEVALAMCRGI